MKKPATALYTAQILTGIVAAATACALTPRPKARAGRSASRRFHPEGLHPQQS